MSKKGYAKIAAQMAKYPESAMVRQFHELNLQNILYLQAELVGLELDFRKYECENEGSANEEKAAASLDWAVLSQYGEDEGSDAEEEDLSEQWQLALKIRKRLREYNEAVIQYSQISSLSHPKARDLHNFQDWMRRPVRGDVHLTGRDRFVWSDGQDLVALKHSSRRYPLARWLINALPSFHTLLGRYFKKEEEGREVFYSDKKVMRIAALIGTVVACLLPMVAVVVLYTVRGMAVRLGLISVFTAMFSTCLWVMTDGKLIEVFAATSTFSAVCVVFISQND